MPTSVALKPVDPRSGFERLSGRGRERIGDDARSNTLFVLPARWRTTVKVAFVEWKRATSSAA